MLKKKRRSKMDINKNQIQKTILEKFEAEAHEFQPHPQAIIKGLQLHQNHEFGFLLITFRLDQTRRWNGLSEAQDAQILEVLDDLSAKRKIKILRAEITRDIHFNDVKFIAEIGRGVLQPRHAVVGWEVGYKSLYWQPGRAMTKKEFDSFNPIVKPSKVVKNIRARRDRHFKVRFGSSNEMTILRKLHREALVKEIADKQAMVARK
jgi:hypothetical protein